MHYVPLSQRRLRCGGKLLDLSQPHVMGILNVTPDSFYSDYTRSHLWSRNNQSLYNPVWILFAAPHKPSISDPSYT